MVHRYVSMDMRYIELVNYIQTFPYENKKQTYIIYREMIPKSKTYLRYIKSKIKKQNTSLVEYVAKYFECGLGEAEEYIDILREKGSRDILYKMGIDKKEVEKLLKK